MKQRPLPGNTMEYSTAPSPCETANDGLGCGLIDSCSKHKMSCFDYYAYCRADGGGGRPETFYPEPMDTPTKEIYALMFTDGIKSLGVYVTKRIHRERFGGIS